MFKYKLKLGTFLLCGLFFFKLLFFFFFFSFLIELVKHLCSEIVRRKHVLERIRIIWAKVERVD